MQTLTITVLSAIWLWGMLLLLPRAKKLQLKEQTKPQPLPKGPARSVLRPHLPAWKGALAFL